MCILASSNSAWGLSQVISCSYSNNSSCSVMSIYAQYFFSFPKRVIFRFSIFSFSDAATKFQYIFLNCLCSFTVCLRFQLNLILALMKNCLYRNSFTPVSLVFFDMSRGSNKGQVFYIESLGVFYRPHSQLTLWSQKRSAQVYIGYCLSWGWSKTNNWRPWTVTENPP